MKSIAFVAVLVLATLVFVACGGGDSKGGILGGAKAPGATEGPAGLTPSSLIPTLASGRTPTSSATTAARTPTARADREDWQAAMLDDSKSLPGDYVAPHPGADGTVCETKSCTNRHDDRNHVTATIPICTQAQLSSRSYSNPLCYNSNPPTSGPHASTWADPGVFNDPVAKERLVHSMEHANVIIWYNTTDAATIRTLAQITNGANNSRKLVVMSPYAGMEPNTIALTSWTRLDKFPVSQFKDQRVLDFINAHSKRFNPEGF